MRSPVEGTERHVLPRWRAANRARGLSGALDVFPGASSVDAAAGAAQFESLRLEFLDNRTFSFAADLLSAAVASSREDLAKDAAEVVLEEKTQLPAALVRMAHHVLGHDGAEVARTRAEEPRSPSETIKVIRQRLRTYDTGALDWIDLALAYVSVGQLQKAERAVRTALGLSQENRHVLRSASRFFVHQGRPDLAVASLNATERILADPWILSAEIAAASVAKRTSKHLKAAKRMLESRDFSPLDLSELAASVASFEAENAAVKPAVKHMRHALIAPTENTLAQAEWFNRNVRLLGNFREEAAAEPRAFEARASVSLYSSEWENTLKQARSWMADEPYSGRPAMMSSFVAGMILGDYALAERELRSALLSSPGDPGLTNNLAFTLASAGQAINAEKELARLSMTGLAGSLRVATEATRALVRFRLGDARGGELGYREAIDLARKDGLSSAEAMARAMLARELALVGISEKADSEIQLAKEVTAKMLEQNKALSVAVILAASREIEGAKSARRRTE